MANASRQKLLVVTVFFAVLLVLSVSVLVPVVHAADVTAQEKGLAVLKDVVGVDLAKYDVAAEEYPQDAKASYLGVVSQKCVGYELASGASKLKVPCTFTNGHLQMIQVLEKEDAPGLIKPTALFNVFAAKSFLSNYQKYTADPLFGELRSMLDNVDAGKNITKTSGNMVLEVANNDGFTNFKWYYMCNGAIAPYSKFIALGVKDGFLSAFVNNWQLYDVGSTTINLSKEEAIAIALETAKAHSWSLKLDDDALEEKNFNESNVRWTALVFDCSLRAEKARSADPLRLYPVWRVGIALNKWYGYMYGIEVDIWADTKEVGSVQEAWSTLPPPEDTPTANVSAAWDVATSPVSETAPSSLDGQVSVAAGAEPNSTVWITLPTLTAAAVGTATFWVSRKRKSLSLKTGGILFCILISSIMLSAPIATVNATTRAAQIWGSESTGAIDPSTGQSWRKSPNETAFQRSIAAAIASYFAANGYVGYNYQGNYGSWKSNILNNIDWMSDYYDHVAVVAFDHGVGGYPPNAPPGEFHYMFEDNTGTIIGGPAPPPTAPPQGHYTDWNHGVFDMDIYPLTHPGKIVFAFISTCMSADITNQGLIDGVRALGLPFAFTHGRRVVDKSSTPEFTIVTHMSDDGYDDPDWGSQVYIGFPYGSAALAQRIPLVIGSYYHDWVNSFFFHALYCDMTVNQALDMASWQYMRQPFLTSPLRRGFTAVWEGIGQQSGCTMAVYGNGNIRLKHYTPPADAVGPPSVSGPTLGDIGVSYQFSAFAGDPYAHSVKYRFDWGDGSPLEETGWYSDGATAYASHSWSTGGIYNVRVQARCPNSDWSSWSSPYTINIGNQPVWLTVYAIDLLSYWSINPNVWVDDVWVGTAPVSIQLPAGWHTVYVEDPVWLGYFYDYFYYYDWGVWWNPISILVDHDRTIVACYGP